MKIIYYCYGSAHSSVVAAAIHLGQLPMDRRASAEEILALPDFDVARDDSKGHLFFKGIDSMNHEVYTIGLGPDMYVVKRSLLSLIQIYTPHSDRFYFSEALPHINVKAKIGGALSRRYGWVKLGRRLAANGVSQSYFNLLSFVQQTKSKVLQLQNKVD